MSVYCISVSFSFVLTVESASVWLSAPPAEPPKQVEAAPWVPPIKVDRPKPIPREESRPVLFRGKHNPAGFIQQRTGTAQLSRDCCIIVVHSYRSLQRENLWHSQSGQSSNHHPPELQWLADLQVHLLRNLVCRPSGSPRKGIFLPKILGRNPLVASRKFLHQGRKRRSTSGHVACRPTNSPTKRTSARKLGT